MVQGDFNFPAGQWKTPIGAKNVIGYGVVGEGKIRNRKLLVNGWEMDGWMYGWLGNMYVVVCDECKKSVSM